MKAVNVLMICLILLSAVLVSGCATPPVPDVELSNVMITPSSGQAGKDVFTITADYTDNVVAYNPIPNFGNETCDYNDIVGDKTIVVRADNHVAQPRYCTWTDTGLTVGPGYTLGITATGEWQVNVSSATICGADGLTGITVDRFCDDAPTGALIGRIGTPPEPKSGSDPATFGVLSSYTNTFTTGLCGRLWLGINDDADTGTYDDNKGELTVNVTVTLPTLNDEHPRLAVDSLGNVHKVWMGEVSPDHWEIFYAELIGDGPAQKVYKQISACDSYNSTYPSIALDSNDNSHVVWIDFRYGFAAIYYNRVDTDGDCYYDGSSSSRPSNRQISYGGMLLANFDCGRAVGFNVPLLGVTVDTPTNTLYIEHPDIAVDSDDQVHIVWSDNRKRSGNTDGHWEVYYNRINNDGSHGPGTGTLQFSPLRDVTYPNDLLLTDPTTAGGSPTDPCSPKAENWDSMCPAIACSGNSLHIAWQDYRSTPFPGNLSHRWEIYYQQRDIETLYSILGIAPWERIVSHYDATYDSAIPPGLEFNYSGPGDPGSDGYSSVSPDIGVEKGCKGTVLVTANPLWTESGCTVEVGDLVDITASGSWNPGGAPCGPDGYSASYRDWYDNFYDANASPSYEHAMLIAFVGEDPYKPDGDHDWGQSIWPAPVGDGGGYWPIGSQFQFTSDRRGKLWLGFNDDANTGAIGDNTGNVTANITASGRVEITWMDQRPTWWQGWGYDPNAVGSSSNNNERCDTQKVNGQYCWEVYIAVMYPSGRLSSDPWIGGLGIKRESDMTVHVGGGNGLGHYTGASQPDDNSMYPRMAVEPNLTDTSQTHIAWHDYRDGNCNIYYKHIPSWCKNPNPDKWVTFDSEEDMYPDVALQQLAGDYRACIKWQSDRSGSWRIYDSHRMSKKDKDAAYMYAEIQPEGQPYPTDVMTFDMHPLIPSRNATTGVPVTYGCTFVISEPGHYQCRVQSRDSAGYELTTDWVTGPMVS
jgi:hypothetical protein